MADVGVGNEDVSAAARELRALEPIFHRSPAGSSRAVFEGMTTPEFWEVGASGRRYERDVVLDAVAERYARGEPEPALGVRDFAATALGGATYLVTYELDQEGRRSRRMTIWTRAETGWKASYHQGTLLAD